MTKVMVRVVAAFGFVFVVLCIAVYSMAFAAFMAGDRWHHGDPHNLTNDIPADMLNLYIAAGEQFGVPWQLLAAVGKVECDHHRNPTCDTPNPAGAVGPMQLLPETFQRWSNATGSAVASILDEHDAVFAAAAKLAADGSDADPHQALYAYNHSDSYVATVEALAVGYGWAPDRDVAVWAVEHHPNITLTTNARRDLDTGVADPRVPRVLLVMATRHRLGAVGPITTGHRELVDGTDRRSNHADGRAVDIPIIDGKPVSVDNQAARDAVLLAAINHATPEDVLSEVGSPFELDLFPARTFTEGHDDHLHFGWDQ